MKTKLFTWDDFTGLLGTSMAVIMPLIKALLPVVQFIGAVAGVVLVISSIYHKSLEIKKLKKHK